MINRHIIRKDYAQRILIALFAGALALPMLWHLKMLPGFFVESTPGAANRLRSFAEISKRFEDEFPRQRMMSLYNHLRQGLFDEVPVTVVVGRDGWLYYRSEVAKDGHSLDDFKGAVTVSEQRLAEWTRKLQDRELWCHEHAIHYLAVIAPNKESIYPEFLPDAIIRQRAAITRCDRVGAALATALSTNFMDLRATLRTAKDRGQLYFRTDTHWNNLGQLLAAQAIGDRLRSILPQLPRPELKDYAITRRVFSGDIAQLAQLTDRFHEDVDFLTPRHMDITSKTGPGENADIILIGSRKSLPTAMVFGDSFAQTIAPFLAEHFSRTIVVHGHFNRARIISENVDVIIDEAVERYIDHLFE